ncbi:hypothetical protein ACFL6I_24135 [candidate division KSB1 bacterium]
MSFKRGQITLFIIIGVVILSALGLFLYLRGQVAEEEEFVPADIAPIKVFVDKCLEETAKDAILVVSLQGGYYLAPENSLNFLGLKIPYYLY